jgi:hypothetical protein
MFEIAKKDMIKSIVFVVTRHTTSPDLIPLKFVYMDIILQLLRTLMY